MRRITFILFMAVICSFNADALAVVSDYLENGTLFLADDTSKLYGIRLQNPSSEEIRLQLTYDDAIAKVIDYEEIYTIPPKTNKAVFFNISALNAEPGNTYTVGYTIHQLSGSGPGVPILLKINKNFKVKIIKNPNKFYVNYSYITYAAALVLLLFILYVFRKKTINYPRGKRKTKSQKKRFENRKIIK